MIDKEKYSKESFEAIRHDPKRVRDLIGQLQHDVTIELQGCVLSKIQEVASVLNTVGHQLKENEPDGPEDTDFCEYHDDEAAKTCGFRLGTTLIVSAGYYKVGEEYLQED